MAWLLKREIHGVSLGPAADPLDRSVGRTVVKTQKLTPEEFFSPDPLVREQFHHDNLLLHVAGDAAVAVLTGRSRTFNVSAVDWDLPLEHDHVEVVAQAARALGTGNDRKIRAYVLQCRREAKAKLREHWHVVEAVAQALLERDTLSTDEIQRIIGQATDGRSNPA